jgi:hypothetical protein
VQTVQRSTGVVVHFRVCNIRFQTQNTGFLEIYLLGVGPSQERPLPFSEISGYLPLKHREDVLFMYVTFNFTNKCAVVLYRMTFIIVSTTRQVYVFVVVVFLFCFFFNKKSSMHAQYP